MFHPVVVIGGFEGYYDSNHRFVSSAPGVRIRVQSRVANVPPVRVVGPRPAPRPFVAPKEPAPVARIAPTPRPTPVAPRAAPAARPTGGGGGRRK
jgi:hypothetical protein